LSRCADGGGERGLSLGSERLGRVIIAGGNTEIRHHVVPHPLQVWVFGLQIRRRALVDLLNGLQPFFPLSLRYATSNPNVLTNAKKYQGDKA
jgi:hypothetical protein